MTKTLEQPQTAQQPLTRLQCRVLLALTLAGRTIEELEARLDTIGAFHDASAINAALSELRRRGLVESYKIQGTAGFVHTLASGAATDEALDLAYDQLGGFI